MEVHCYFRYLISRKEWRQFTSEVLGAAQVTHAILDLDAEWRRLPAPLQRVMLCNVVVGAFYVGGVDYLLLFPVVWVNRTEMVAAFDSWVSADLRGILPMLMETIQVSGVMNRASGVGGSSESCRTEVRQLIDRNRELRMAEQKLLGSEKILAEDLAHTTEASIRGMKLAPSGTYSPRWPRHFLNESNEGLNVLECWEWESMVSGAHGMPVSGSLLRLCDIAVKKCPNSIDLWHWRADLIEAIPESRAALRERYPLHLARVARGVAAGLGRTE